MLRPGSVLTVSHHTFHPCTSQATFPQRCAGHDAFPRRGSPCTGGWLWAAAGACSPIPAPPFYKSIGKPEQQGEVTGKNEQ